MKDFVIPDRDFGTPAIKSKQMVTLTIDGFAVTVPAGTSIMRAAAEAGIQVPKLCATDSVDAFGSCRLCLVEIDGRNGTPSSCTTPVAPGLNVHTQTARLKQLRRGVSDEQVVQYMTDRYGDFVRYRPPFKSSTVLLWAGPAVLLLAGLTTLFLVLRRRSRLAADQFDPDNSAWPEPAALGDRDERAR